MTRPAATLLLLAIAACAPPPGEGPRVAVVDGMQRIGPDQPVDEQEAIQLFAARGEYEPFQVIVSAPANALTDVDVVAGDLVSSSGARIDARHFTLYRQHYVRSDGSSSWRRSEALPPGAREINEPGGAGWYPEPLIPFVDPVSGEDLSGSLDAVPFDLTPHTNQPIWIDIFVPRDTPRGDYTANITVRSDQGAAEVRVTLRVWGFELPLQPSLKSDFALGHAKDRRSKIQLLRHKLMPRYLGDFAWQDDFVDVYGLANINIGFWSRLDLSQCRGDQPKMREPPDPAAVRETVARYRPEVATHAYFADEIGRCRRRDDIAAKVRRYASALQEGGTTPLLTVPPLDEFQSEGPYIWALTPKDFLPHAEAVERARRRGQNIWSYNSLYHDNYSPKWLLDYDGVNHRIQPGFISQSMGLEGLLYWKVDHWVEGREWDDLGRGAQPGDGTFVYPGEPVGLDGVQPGIRLKWLREGIEDYEYVELLKYMGEQDFALEVARSVGENFRSWRNDPEAVYAARKRLGERLDSLVAKSARCRNGPAPEGDRRGGCPPE